MLINELVVRRNDNVEGKVTNVYTADKNGKVVNKATILLSNGETKDVTESTFKKYYKVTGMAEVVETVPPVEVVEIVEQAVQQLEVVENHVEEVRDTLATVVTPVDEVVENNDPNVTTVGKKKIPTAIYNDFMAMIDEINKLNNVEVKEVPRQWLVKAQVGGKLVNIAELKLTRNGVLANLNGKSFNETELQLVKIVPPEYKWVLNAQYRAKTSEEFKVLYNLILVGVIYRLTPPQPTQEAK